MAAMESIMELTYSNQLDGFDPEKRYRNPDLFRLIERDATTVVIVGDYPEIAAAYEAVGVEVTLSAHGSEQDKLEPDPKEMSVGELREWLTARGIEYDAKAPKLDLLKLIPAS